MKTPFTYTVVRYGPDAVSGEFVNVGVVVYAPKAHFLRAKCTTRYGRISRFLGEIDGQHFRQMMNHIVHGVRNIEKSFSTLMVEAPADVIQALRHVISIEDVTITYAEPKGGLTRDAAKTLEDVYHRFVGRHEEDTKRRGRQDADVWRSFREELDEAGVLPALKPYRVEAPLLSYDFEHAWKNGTWHALEPVSFDLLDPDSITDKANKWLGRATNLSEASESVRLFYLVGMPSKRKELLRAYDQAVKILDKSPLAHELVIEQSSSDFARRMRELIDEHEQMQDDSN